MRRLLSLSLAALACATIALPVTAAGAAVPIDPGRTNASSAYLETTTAANRTTVSAGMHLMTSSTPRQATGSLTTAPIDPGRFAATSAVYITNQARDNATTDNATPLLGLALT